MTKIYLVRHAEAEGNLYRRVHGWYDSLLTDNGCRQLAALERRFADIPIDAVYSSDLLRARATAGAICKPKGLPLHTDVGLREVHMGWWEDRTWGELLRVDAGTLDLFNHASPAWKVPGGESLDEVRRRVGNTIKKLAARHQGQSIAVVSHGTAIRNTLAWFQGLPVEESAGLPHSDNTAVSRLELDGERVQVVFAHDASHLPPDSSLFSTQQWWKLTPEEALEERRTTNLWFRPLDFSAESELYVHARQEAWRTIHGVMDRFNSEAFLADARTHSRRDPSSVLCAMREDRVAGILQMDLARGAQEGVGAIPFYYMTPEARSKGLGVQLLGQAVSTYRALGRNRLRLRCAPKNAVGQKFYKKYGFYKVGEEPGGLGTLDLLEKYIGYGENT